MRKNRISIMSADKYVNFNKRILKIVGLYPVNFLRYFACILSMSLIALPQVFQLYMDRNDFSVILETSSVVLTMILTILKSFVWVWKHEIQKLVEYLLTDYWQIAKSADNNDRMQVYAKSGRKVTRGYFFLITNTLIVFFTLRPLKSIVSKLQGTHEKTIGEEKGFPFPAKYPNFFYESPFYEITYGSQMLATGLCGLMMLAIDSLIATALFHTCGHLKVIHDNFLSLDSYVDEAKCAENVKIGEERIYSNDVSGNLHKRLTTIVNHHQVVIRFSDSMERAFNSIMFLQVSASCLIICLAGFQVTSTTARSDRLVEYYSYLGMALGQILLFCWPGDEIMCHSSMIGDAAFSMKWYNVPSNVKMGISFIILRSQKPNTLTAGKFYTMCMKTFATILNTSMSYLMLLRKVNSN